MKNKKNEVLPGQLSIWDSPFYDILMGGGVSLTENTEQGEVKDDESKVNGNETGMRNNARFLSEEFTER